jgi:hypothetical protein
MIEHVSSWLGLKGRGSVHCGFFEPAANQESCYCKAALWITVPHWNAVEAHDG